VAVRALAGDRAALDELWRGHRRWVAAVLLAHAPRAMSGRDLDDLLQDVAAAVVGKIGGLRDAAAFKPWLRAVTLSVARAAGRREKVRRQGWLRLTGRSLVEGRQGEEDSEGAAGDGGGEQAVLVEGRRLLALSRELPEGYCEPLLLKCVQGMSYRQIGAVMGLPETTIETRIARARRMLRERAEQQGLGEGVGAAGERSDVPTPSDERPERSSRARPNAGVAR
jgi:RNA polymerase sigma-70 factor (ECF subfamily)